MKILLLIALLIWVKISFSQESSNIFDEAVKSVAIVTDTYESGIGSGFFVNENTFITNKHVSRMLKRSSMVIKTKNGNEYSVKRIIKEYSNSDLCLIEIDGTTQNYYNIAHLNEIKTGEKIYAIGNPVSVDYKVYDFNFTEGIINNITYENVSSRDFSISAKVIVHSASLNPGNSGGPLLNSKCELVGINSFYKQGYANNMFFAVHLSEIIDALDDNGIRYYTSDSIKNKSSKSNTDSAVSNERVNLPGKKVQGDSLVVSYSTSDNFSTIVILVFLIGVPLIAIPIYINKRKRKAQAEQRIPVPIYTEPLQPEKRTENIVNVPVRNASYVVANGRTYNIGERGLLIGRHSSCDIVFNDKTMSREHAQIIFDGANYVILDLGSKNGTSVNGQKIKKSVLKYGDIVSIGNNILNIFIN